MTTHIPTADIDLAVDDVVPRRWADRAHGVSIVDPARLRVSDAPVAAYRDNQWPLAALGDASRPTIVFEQRMRRKAASMGWRDIEPRWREPLKRLGWLMINRPAPDVLLTAPGHNYVARPGAGTIASTVTNLGRFLQWVNDLDGITEIRQIDEHHLQQWAKHLHTRGLKQPNAFTRPLTYLWAWGAAEELPDRDVLIRPFWIRNPAALSACRHTPGEGRQPLSAETMDPLIWWAVELVERFSPDCLKALHWRHALAPAMSNRSTAVSTRAASAWLRSLREHPRLCDTDERVQRDLVYLTAISPGLTHGAIRKGLRELVVAGEQLPPLAPIGAPKPIPVPTTARVNGQPWLQLDWRHIASRGQQRSPLLWTVLQGACAVVIGYLGAGPRPLELRTLTRGCLEIQHLDAGALRYLIHGRIRKRQRDEIDQQSRDGIEHAWPALPQAARAIQVLENLPDPRRSQRLFTDPDGRPLEVLALNKAIRAFIEFANRLAHDHRLPAIADDPGGVTTSRLRRTIGPFIRNRPDGAFGLAVVYGHASSVIGAHYGGMKQSGSTRFLPRETADHIAATLDSISASLQHGGGLSGPAARHAINAANTYQGALLTSRDWKKILTNPTIQAYDNPDRAVGCRFDPAIRPPCQNDTVQDARTEPDLTNCRASCFNRFYTDEHAHEHQRRAEELELWAELAPTPEAARLRRVATEHRATAQQHWTTRIGADGAPRPVAIADATPPPDQRS